MSISIFNVQKSHRGILSEGLNFTLAAHMKHWTAESDGSNGHFVAAVSQVLVEIQLFQYFLHNSYRGILLSQELNFTSAAHMKHWTA